MTDTDFRERMIRALQDSRMSVAELARRSGVSYDVINKLKRRENRSTSAENAEKLRRALGIGNSEPSADDHTDTRLPVRIDPTTVAPNGMKLVNVYDISAAAGDGMLVDEYEAVAARLAFPPDYLRHITSTAPQHLAIISVTGGSMTPTLHHDDIVMVDMTKRNISYDGMFVIRHDDLLKVKRLRWGTGRETIKIISDNRLQFPEEEVHAREVEIVGRVVWVGAKQP